VIAAGGIADGRGIAAAHASNCVGCWASNGGAIVALDPRDGSILALASNPTYKPSIFNSRDPKKLAPLLNTKVAQKDNLPAIDRARRPARHGGQGADARRPGRAGHRALARRLRRSHRLRLPR